MIAKPGIGHNQPDPYAESLAEIEDLWLEACHWADGSQIASQEAADAVSKLINLIREAKARAEDRRKTEKRPHDEAAAAVQARYNPLVGKDTGKCDMALAACRKALTPYLVKLDEAQKAEAARLKAIAEANAAAAAEAIRATSGTLDLAARASAERFKIEANHAAAAAKRAAKARPLAVALEGRAVGLRVSRQALITDPRLFARWAWEHCPHDMAEFLAELAQRCVDRKQTPDGVTIVEIQGAA